MDKEKLISEILRRFAELEPSASKKLTQRIPKNDRGSPQSKFKKVELIAKEHPEILKNIAYSIFGNDLEAKNPLGYSSKSLLNSIFDLVKEEPVGGSFGIRYGHGEGPTE